MLAVLRHLLQLSTKFEVEPFVVAAPALTELRLQWIEPAVDSVQGIFAMTDRLRILLQPWDSTSRLAEQHAARSLWTKICFCLSSILSMMNQF